MHNITEYLMTKDPVAISRHLRGTDRIKWPFLHSRSDLGFVLALRFQSSSSFHIFCAMRLSLRYICLAGGGMKSLKVLNTRWIYLDKLSATWFSDRRQNLISHSSNVSKMSSSFLHHVMKSQGRVPAFWRFSTKIRQFLLLRWFGDGHHSGKKQHHVAMNGVLPQLGGMPGAWQSMLCLVHLCNLLYCLLCLPFAVGNWRLHQNQTCSILGLGGASNSHWAFLGREEGGEMLDMFHTSIHKWHW